MCTTWRSHMCDMTHLYVWHDLFTRANESCHTYEWVMSHVWMSHVTHMNEVCHTYEWVMSHVWMSRVTHMNASCHTHDQGIHTCQGYIEALTLPPSDSALPYWSADSAIRMTKAFYIWMCHVIHRVSASIPWSKVGSVVCCTERETGYCRETEIRLGIVGVLHKNTALLQNSLNLTFDQGIESLTLVTQAWVISHMWMSKITYEWFIPHIQMRHVTHMTKSFIYVRAMSILKSELVTQLTMKIDYRADFWEFL